MEPKEPLEIRRQMVEMHMKFRKNLSDLMAAENYIAASWICYSIFEQRINRIMQKHIDQCNRKPFCNSKNPQIAAISVKLRCLDCLISNEYGGYAQFDKSLPKEILDWCNKRNKLTHTLINLNDYNDYNQKFQELARHGAMLVDRLYDAADKFREWWETHQYDKDFPVPKTKEICDRKYHCVPEGGDIVHV